jgi:hypothetical protein
MGRWSEDRWEHYADFTLFLVLIICLPCTAPQQRTFLAHSTTCSAGA